MKVTERRSPTVRTLKLINTSALPVLILDGEELVGGWQNRIVTTTLLVPARTTFDLPVSCVEAQRWHAVQPEEDAPGRHETTIRILTGRKHTGESAFWTGETAYPSLRSLKLKQVADAEPAPVCLAARSGVITALRAPGGPPPTGAPARSSVGSAHRPTAPAPPSAAPPPHRR